MAEKKYDASSVEQLTFREGVRARIGIYLGSADHTGVIAGLLELVNNATDEALVCPTATQIELTIGKDWASCRDYGRGMPHGKNSFSDEVMINLLTENHSGAKFNENAYGGKSRGLNGTGSAATCCSSDIFEITSYRDKAAWYMKFINSPLVKNFLQVRKNKVHILNISQVHLFLMQNLLTLILKKSVTSLKNILILIKVLLLLLLMQKQMK